MSDEVPNYTLRRVDGGPGKSQEVELGHAQAKPEIRPDKVVTPEELRQQHDEDPASDIDLIGSGTLASAGPLMPRYDEGQHRVYLDHLLSAINDEESTNIALTGAYGVGKSSILRGLKDQVGKKIVEVSLSTMNPFFNGTEAGVPEQDPDRTNLIQKEIVKQLLYRLPVHKAPQSKFRRAATISWWDPFISVGWAAAVFLIVFLTGATSAVITAIAPDGWPNFLAQIGWFGSILLVIHVLRQLLRGRVAVGSVSAGPAQLSLSEDGASSYFDEYLDEIVYFFDASRRSIVIVEDIDRFEDTIIFDTLRSLNTLLNRSGQLDRKIVFIYAVRDSVFERLHQHSTPGKEEPSNSQAGESLKARGLLPASNRTKFFDVIIPVVPFITHSNARDLLKTELLSSDYDISPDLIRLAAKYLVDMRLIRNIRQELDVYRNRLIRVSNPVPGINENLLLALLLHKNTSLGDFEAIRFRESTLDRLHTAWREWVQSELKSSGERLTKLRVRMRNLEHIDDRAKAASAKLVELQNALLEALPAEGFRAGAQRVRLRVDGAPIEAESLNDDTWTRIAGGASVGVLLFSPGGGGVELFPTNEQLSAIIGTTLEPDHWRRQEAEQLLASIADIETYIGFLNHHTWQELCQQRPNSPVTTDGSKFLTAVDLTLETDLVKDLVRHGHITEHFSLYVSMFYGEHLSANALDYLLRYIDPGTSEPSYTLTPTDVAELITDKADSFIDSPSAYNKWVLDYTLKHNTPVAERIASHLRTWGDDERSFLEFYAVHGDAPADLVGLMTPHWPEALHFTCSLEIDPDRKLEMVNAALSTVQPEACHYLPDESVQSFLEANYLSLPALRQPPSQDHARQTFQAVKATGMMLSELTSLNEAALAQVSDNGLYRITLGNLQSLSPEGLSLDQLGDHHPVVYVNMIRNAVPYTELLKSAEPPSHSIDTTDHLNDILRDIANFAPQRDIKALLDQVAPEVILKDLSPVGNKYPVEKTLWIPLLETNRLSPSFQNINIYIGGASVLDETIATYLIQHGTLTWNEETDPLPDRLVLATLILNSSETIPDPEVRVRLADSLAPGHVQSTDLKPERGQLVRLMIRQGLLEADARALSSRLMLDWATTELSMSEFDKLATIISPEILPTNYVAKFLSSQNIKADAKKIVTADLSSYLTTVTETSAGEIGRALVDTSTETSASTIEELITAGAEKVTIVQLIARQGEGLRTDELRTLLRRIGGDYAIIADRGRAQPTFPDDEDHKRILERLVSCDVVSSWAEEGLLGPRVIRVHLRRP